MLVNKNINNLSGGISQQPEPNRFDNQVESMDNFLITVAQGLRKRNPTQSLATIPNITFDNNMAIHSYDRGDGKEKYFMTYNDDGIRVFDVNGVEKTVNDISNVVSTWNTVAGTDWKTKLKFLTVGDTTWVLNKDVVVNYTSPDDLVVENRAFYWISKTTTVTYGTSNASFKGYNYQVVLDGTTYDAYTLVGQDTTDSINVAKTFATSISGNVSNRFFAKSVGSILMIIKGDYTSVADAYGAAISVGYNNEYHIKISATSDGANPEYYDMTSNVDRATALSKMTQGWYMSVGTTETFKMLSEFFVQIIGAEVDILVESIRYYNGSNYTYSGATAVSIQHYKNGSSFSFASGDSFGNQASSGWIDSVAKLSDLPVEMNGFSTEEVGTIAITGTDRDSFTNYYLKWNQAENKWVETFRPDTSIIIDETTMPAKLVRQSDGTFALGFNSENQLYNGFTSSWDMREKGDDDSNPMPSFIGSTIENMFFFKNRLGFTSGENVSMSEASSYYNFFATTAMEVLDSDPIDVTIDSNTVSLIRNVNVVGNAVTLWADNAQFLLSGGEILSPATTRVSQTSAYSCDNKIAPLAVDNEVMFFRKTGSYIRMSSYAPASLQADKTDAEDLTSHVPEFLPYDISDVKCSPSHNLMFMLSPLEPTKLYVYKYFITNNKRIVSSWFTWSFLDTISSIEVIDGTLYLFVNTNEVLTMNLEPLPLNSAFLDKGINAYESNVLMSSFNVQTREETQIIREPFYVKNIKVESIGLVDVYTKNSERNNLIITTKNKHINRKLFIGGNSEKVNIGFSSSYGTGCEIDLVNIEGRIKTKSRNV